MQNLHTWLGIARRTAFQAIGTVVAIFASGRVASAADITYTGLYCYGDNDHDYLSSYDKITWMYGDGGACSQVGAVDGVMRHCVRDNGWVPMYNQECVEKLQKLGLCEHTNCAVGGDGRPMSEDCKILNTYGIGGALDQCGAELSCADIDGTAAQSCELVYSSGYDYKLVYLDSCEDRKYIYTLDESANDMSAPYAWALCDFSSGIAGVICKFYQSGVQKDCDDRHLSPSNYAMLGSGLSASCPDNCTQEFQEYFNNNYILAHATGACLGSSGNISVYGSAYEIALIYEFCYKAGATDGEGRPYVGEWEPGCMFESCQYNSGWFLNIPNPGFDHFADWDEVAEGSGVCAPCVTGIAVSGMENMSPQWNSGAVKYTALSPSQWEAGMSGSTSCRATIPTTSYSGKTSSGTFVLELQESGVCKYN